MVVIRYMVRGIFIVCLNKELMLYIYVGNTACLEQDANKEGSSERPLSIFVYL